MRVVAEITLYQSVRSIIGKWQMINKTGIFFNGTILQLPGIIPNGIFAYAAAGKSQQQRKNEQQRFDQFLIHIILKKRFPLLMIRVNEINQLQFMNPFVFICPFKVRWFTGHQKRTVYL